MIKPKRWFTEPDTVEFIKKSPGIFRICNLRVDRILTMAYILARGWTGDLSPYVQCRKMLPENFNMVYGISSHFGYSTLILQRYADIRDIILSENIQYKDYPEMKASLTLPVVRFLGLENVKYIISVFDIENENLQLRMRTKFHSMVGDIKVYENKMFMPRVFVVPEARYVYGRHDICNALIREDFNPRKTVILEERVSHGSNSVKGSAVNIEDYSDKEVKVSVDLTGDGFLVLTDTNYPGWNVYVDGRKGRILQANYLFRAVALDKGRHNVIFKYEPLSFRKGLYISLFTLLLIIIFGVRSLILVAIPTTF
ncbi:hypothetical protein ES703_103000 [subsurface metagenome]